MRFRRSEEPSLREIKKIFFFISRPGGWRWYPRASNSWCELSMIDDGETGQFTNCYWEYLSSRTTNNPGPRQTRYLHSQQKVSPLRKVLQSGWWSEGGRDSEEIKDVFMQKTEIWKIWNNLLLHIFLKEKQGKTCFLGSPACFAGIRL